MKKRVLKIFIIILFILALSNHKVWARTIGDDFYKGSDTNQQFYLNQENFPVGDYKYLYDGMLKMFGFQKEHRSL